MPSFDAGYYHLTALIPILPSEGSGSASTASAAPGRPCWHWQPEACSPVQSLRELLGSLRSVEVPELEGEGAAEHRVARALPFSRNRRTHFARLLVVEELAWNGPQRGDTLLDLLRGLLPFPALRAAGREAAESLPGPCLLVLLDFDAPDGSRGSVERYLNELWDAMEPEWTLILRHCQGFEADPGRCRRSFLALLLEHEIETTFSFCAYPWAAAQAARWQLATGSILPPQPSNRWGALLPGALWAGMLLLSLLAPLLLGLRAVLRHSGLPGGWCWLLPPLLLLSALPLLWQRLLREAQAPWPAQPGTDLGSLLKALHLQGRFLELAEDWQQRRVSGESSLRQRFRAFLEEERPQDPEGPTLSPGLIGVVRRRPAA